MSPSGKARDFDSRTRRSESGHPSQKSENFVLGFFYPSRRLGISSAARRYIIKGGNAALVYHHAIACIFLRLDDIQCFALMICNSYGIDDIHAFGVIGMRECEDFRAFRVCRQIRTSEMLKCLQRCGIMMLERWCNYEFMGNRN